MIFGAALATCAAALALVGAFTCSATREPRGKLSDASAADAACRDSARAALGTLRDSLGFAFSVADSDVEELRKTGGVEKSYSRDGVRYSVGVGLDVVDADGCSLRVWSRSTSTPSSTETSAGTFGAQPVPACRCVAR